MLKTMIDDRNKITNKIKQIIKVNAAVVEAYMNKYQLLLLTHVVMSLN